MDIWQTGIPTPVALALVAFLGYLVGIRRRGQEGLRSSAKRELKRAKQVIRELETISSQVRRHLANHHASVMRFKSRVSEIGKVEDRAPWHELSAEAEQMLRPTLTLATQIAHAYDEIRQQTNQLMAFADLRTDPLTGLNNRRALDETLQSMTALQTRYGKLFSLILIDIDHFKKINDERGHLQGDQILQQVSDVFRDCVRETDMVTRFGGEEFVVVAPETDVNESCVVAERIRENIECRLGITVSCGVAMGITGETPEELIARADSALYSAKASGRNSVYSHTGDEIEVVVVQGEAVAEFITDPELVRRVRMFSANAEAEADACRAESA